MQAAGGAALNGAEADATTPPTRKRRPGPYVLTFLGVGVLSLVVDQVTKALAADRLADGASVRVVGDLLRFTLVFNPGAAFSTGTQFTVGLSVLAIVASVVVLWFGFRARTPLWSVGLGLLLAGVTGNLADRLFRAPGPMRGHVVDFLQLPSWPVFNVADMCINVGAVVLVLQAFRGVRLDGRREADRTEAKPDEGPDEGSAA
ncbi:lipoprotein signal peptidase [Marmoricola endophyticus]|uniref:Lipoprotein signal peptidase n=1 Tax=Marmoricola endophyticus TaxID=2040280 RepID=A0A917F2X4_9ACTN|nr:signal peptidase II [Marmoricola endophyticus]GGF37840.1 lipoprotein signal peptidase [Marmoricola endophyticus]